MANDVETIVPDSAIWSGPPTPGNDIFAQEPDHGEIPKCRPVAISAIDNKAGNAANTKFRVMIVEWLYPGPRRWTDLVVVVLVIALHWDDRRQQAAKIVEKPLL